MTLKPFNIYTLLCLFFCGSISSSWSQICGHKHKIAAKTTMASLAEDDYDIKHLLFDIHVTDTSVYVAGNVTTTAQVVVPSMSAYVFELDSSYTIDSAKINGVVRTTSGTGTLRTVNLSTPLTSGMPFTAQIFYHGLPPGGTGGFFNGITHAVTSGGTHVVFTISDPYVAKNWWPCKQSILDKIDSVDMLVHTPRGVADASNGLLVALDSTSAGRTYHWKTKYPIAYYLISIAVAKYSDYRTNMHFTASTDSMLIHNFFMDTATFNPTYKDKFDSIHHIVNYYSELFGRYPFWREKYGVCYTTLPGGMEHQTMTTIGTPDITVIAHELGHQWFGDHVTYKNWGDVWLSEGFATYCEQLYLNRFWSAAAAKSRRLTYIGMALRSTCGKVYVDDTTNSDSLFNGNTVYAKAQGVVCMLQYAAPSDSSFFQLLKRYQSTYAMGHATTANLKTMAESIYGTPLDTFFNQWIYGRGFPIYRVTWAQAGGRVFVRLVQTTSCPSYTRRFSTYVELQLKAGSIDTFIKVYNSLDTQTYVFDYTPTLTNVYLNPNGWTVLQQTGISTRDPKLAEEALYIPRPLIYPNPTSNSWAIEGLEDNKTWTLTDVQGKTIATGRTQKYHTEIPGNQLGKGTYFLKIDQKDSIKLLHW